MKPDFMEMFRYHLHVEQLDWKIKQNCNHYKIMVGKDIFSDDGNKTDQITEPCSSVMHL